MNRLQVVAVLGALCFTVTSAAAQDANDPSSRPQLPAVSDTAPHVAQPSIMDRPSEAFHRSDLKAAPLPASSSGQHLGEAKAEMLVGGAAIVVGALIGGDGGRVLMFGGAVVGLYGLWNYLR